MDSEMQQLSLAGSAGPPAGPPARLNTIPAELLLAICHYLRSRPKDQWRLARTCRRTRDVVVPEIYLIDLRYHDNKAVFWACRHNRADVLSLVLQRHKTPADVANRHFTKNHHYSHHVKAHVKGQTPLAVAIRRGSVGCVQELIRHGANVNARDQLPPENGNFCRYPINWAMLSPRKYRIVDELSAAGADVNASPFNYDVPLDDFAMVPYARMDRFTRIEDSAPIFQVLHQIFKAPPPPEDSEMVSSEEEYNNALSNLIQQRTNLLRLLLARGANPNSRRNTRLGQTPLCYLLLVLRDYKPKWWFPDWATSKDSAIRQRKELNDMIIPVMHLLVQCGADVKDGSLVRMDPLMGECVVSPLQLARGILDSDHEKIVKWLAEEGTWQVARLGPWKVAKPGDRKGAKPSARKVAKEGTWKVAKKVHDH
ncbi:hypothetical protein GGR56DRAFT_534668 [Xylariaceae sp. FL0804]|nr:hypothetical protein GGR56DRAFT_534668 [Xylariaceae sp. FL0804]